MDENENKTYQNLWDVVKAVLKEKFMAAKKDKRSQNN